MFGQLKEVFLVRGSQLGDRETEGVDGETPWWQRLLGWIMGLAGYGTEATLAAMAVALFLVATNTQTGWLYLVSALLGGLLILGYLEPRRQLRGLSFSTSLEGRSQALRTVKLTVEIKNPTSRPRHFLVVEVPPQPWEQPSERPPGLLLERLQAHQSASLSLTVTPAVRGRHRFENLAGFCCAPLGYFGARRSIATSPSFVVLPATEPVGLAEMTAGFAPWSESATSPQKAGISQDLRRLRSYAPGEDQRFVHWPSSARTGQLMVREFARPRAPGLLVWLANLAGCDLGPYPNTAFEAAVKVAASLVTEGRRTGLEVGLVTWHQGGWQTYSDSEQALECLATVTAQADPDTFPKLERACLLTVQPPGPELTAGLNPEDSHIVLFQALEAVQPYRSEDYQASQASLKSQGFRLTQWTPGAALEGLFS